LPPRWFRLHSCCYDRSAKPRERTKYQSAANICLPLSRFLASVCFGRSFAFKLNLFSATR
jgi:hypothetical protein